MVKGKLITLESIDGGGKTTQIDIILNYFKSKNLKFNYFHFPMYGHNQFSELIAKFLRGELGKNDEVDPLFVANIYAMDRFKFLPTLNKSLEENDIVLLDRYVFSNIAYQCAKVDNTNEQNKLMQWIEKFEFEFLNLPYPDLNIFLHVPIEIVRERLENKRSGDDRNYLQGKEDIHEADLAFQDKVRNLYISYMLGKKNCTIKDTFFINKDNKLESLTPENIFSLYKDDIDLLI